MVCRRGRAIVPEERLAQTHRRPSAIVVGRCAGGAARVERCAPWIAIDEDLGQIPVRECERLTAIGRTLREAMEDGKQRAGIRRFAKGSLCLSP
jgi:hypothetical protein